LKNEGDFVRAGETIAEAESDKATVEIESVESGVLRAILSAAGAVDVRVGAPIAVIERNPQPSALAESAERETSATGGSIAPAPSADAEGDLSASVSAEASPSGSASVPQDNPRTDRRGQESLSEERRSDGKGEKGTRLMASPLARRLSHELSIDLAAIRGTGPHGRIVKRDVRGAVALAALTPAANIGAADANAASGGASAPSSGDFAAAAPFDEIPHTSMRRTIARRLTESFREVPHFFLSADCEVDNLLALRRDMNESTLAHRPTETQRRLSINDFVIKALALTLTDVPDANVIWTDNAIRKYRHVDVAVAVSTPDGLITPVIRGADTKTVSAISVEMKELASKARRRSLRPDEYEGGTVSVSNLGMHGIREFSAIINPPQAMILAVGAARPQVIVRQEKPAVAAIMTVTLSCDHRAIDGELAAKVLNQFQRYIEYPIQILS
jgi:pyruvate dehydrogenase E2 component (dihydrolipoamide acetyltransferase)